MCGYLYYFWPLQKYSLKAIVNYVALFSKIGALGMHLLQFLLQFVVSYSSKYCIYISCIENQKKETQ